MKGQSLNQLPVRHPKNCHEAGETKPWTDSFLRRRKIRLCRRLPTLRLAALLRNDGCCLCVFLRRSDGVRELETPLLGAEENRLGMRVRFSQTPRSASA